MIEINWESFEEDQQIEKKNKRNKVGKKKEKRG